MKKLLRWAAWALVAILALLLLLLGRALGLRSTQEEAPAVETVELALGPMVERLAAAVRLRTLSPEKEEDFDPEPFVALDGLLRESFPLAFSTLSVEVIGNHSLLLRWPGSETDLEPMILTAHLDVVPAPAARDWTHPPFAGRIAEGYLWGRGTLDDKGSVLAILEAVEHLLARGFQPRRGLILAFGHDEEVGGRAGAAAMARRLEAEGTRAFLVLDEGFAVTHGLMPGMSAPVAFIGIAEKGFADLELVVETEGGHSSMPPAESAVGILARAIAKIEANPMPATLEGIPGRMFDRLAPEMALPMRLVVANRWLADPLLRSRLAAAPSTNALLRTTLATTIFDAGVKANVLPRQARAVVNARLRPGDRAEAVRAHLEAVIGDPRVRVSLLPGAVEASPVSDSQGEAFRLLARSIRQIFPRAAVAPGLVLAGTDAKHYVGLSDSVFRFAPMRLAAEDLARLHGVDERVSHEDYGDFVRFYLRLIENMQGGYG